MWTHWCSLAGLEGSFASHTGRKTFGYINRVEGRASVAVLMKAYGHAPAATTLTYALLRAPRSPKLPPNGALSSCTATAQLSRLIGKFVRFERLVRLARHCRLQVCRQLLEQEVLHEFPRTLWSHFVVPSFVWLPLD